MKSRVLRVNLLRSIQFKPTRKVRSMKIENQDLLGIMYAAKLAVLRSSKSTLEQVIDAYKSDVPEPEGGLRIIGWSNQERFIRHVVVVAFRTRILALLDNAETFDSAFAIWKVLDRDKFREQAALRALELANCNQALELYRGLHNGVIAEQTLTKAARLAKSQEQLWQVAVHSRACGNKELWKRAVKKLKLQNCSCNCSSTFSTRAHPSGVCAIFILEQHF